jgi:hypothetical protein
MLETVQFLHLREIEAISSRKQGAGGIGVLAHKGDGS